MCLGYRTGEEREERGRKRKRRKKLGGRGRKEKREEKMGMVNEEGEKGRIEVKKREGEKEKKLISNLIFIFYSHSFFFPIEATSALFIFIIFSTPLLRKKVQK